MSEPWTPGPWMVLLHSDEDTEIEVGRDLKTLPNGITRGDWVCVVGNGEDFIDDEVEANAALIASAPELFKALERLTRLLKENYQLDDLAEQVIKRAESALARARGEQPADKAQGRETLGSESQHTELTNNDDSYDTIERI